MIDRCRREITAIEAELLAGNPDVEALSDWSTESRILQRGSGGPDADGARQTRERLEEAILPPADPGPPEVMTIHFVEADRNVAGKLEFELGSSRRGFRQRGTG
jgi:hypothetical protein